MAGVDISPPCIALARREQPGLRFAVMDLARMAFADGSIDGLVAYYSLHDQPAPILSEMVREFSRVLRPGGRILVVAKEGHGERWIPDPLGSGRDVFWKGFQPEEPAALLSSCAFRIQKTEVRDPLPDEIAARRIYVSGERCGC